MTNAPESPGFCLVCHRELDARFEIVHFGRDARYLTRVQVCSLACVIRWAISYGIDLGRRGVQSILRALPALPSASKPSLRKRRS